MIKGNLFLLF